MGTRAMLPWIRMPWLAAALSGIRNLSKMIAHLPAGCARGIWLKQAGLCHRVRPANSSDKRPDCVHMHS